MERLCRCFATPPPTASTRAARVMAHGDRARALFIWMDVHEEQAAQMLKLKAAVQALANVPLRRGQNQWRAAWAEAKSAMALLRTAVCTIVNSKVRKVFNTWTGMVCEKHELLCKLRAAASALSPEGLAKKAFMRKLVWIKRRREVMLKAAHGFILAGCRFALQRMHSQLEQLRKLRRGGNAIRLRKARQCWNQWAEAAAAGKHRQQRMATAAKRMTPEGRMLNHAFNMLLELLQDRQQLRASLSGFVMGSQKRAMSAWIELTFVGFHLAAGGSDFSRYRQRKAVRLWVARAKVRRGLRKHVWTCARKGEVELARLLDLIADSDSDDVASAIVGHDGDGSTPLLFAAKKGFAIVAETLIGTAHDIAHEGAGVLTEADLAAMVNAADADGNSALHWAARKGHEAVAVQLIESGGCPAPVLPAPAAHRRVRSALRSALPSPPHSSRSSRDLSPLPGLHPGALLDFINKEESTPLHWAARKHNGAIIELLLHAGASALIVNKWGASALDNAKAVRGDSRAVELLAEAAAVQSKKGFLFSTGQQQQQQQQQQQAGQQQQEEEAMGRLGETETVVAGGEASRLAHGVPRGEKAKAAQRRQAANQRREAALKARDAQEEAKAKDLLLRRQRAAVELKLRELGDAVSPALLDVNVRAKVGDTHLRARAASPPKLATTQALRDALEAAKELGGCNSQVIGEAEAKLMQAQELRARQKRDAERKTEKERGRAQQSPGGKRRPGEKSEQEKMAQMEKKLLRQRARAR